MFFKFDSLLKVWENVTIIFEIFGSGKLYFCEKTSFWWKNITHFVEIEIKRKTRQVLKGPYKSTQIAASATTAARLPPHDVLIEKLEKFAIHYGEKESRNTRVPQFMPLAVRLPQKKRRSRNASGIALFSSNAVPQWGSRNLPLALPLPLKKGAI